MVPDHIHYVFSGLCDIPLWFSMLGRLSAPLFIFISANGIRYTRHPEKYILRLWIGSVVMNLGNKIINTYFPLPGGGIIFNNIFATLFISCLIIYCIQKLISRQKEKQPLLPFILIMSIPFISSILIILAGFRPGFAAAAGILLTFVPPVLFCEGSILFVLLGIGFYFCADRKKRQAWFYILFCVLILLSGYRPENGILSIFTSDIQWMMIFALPVILLYNNQKGAGMKYFFYIFYPAHIYLFAILAFYSAGR